MKLEDMGQETPVFIQAGQETLSGIVGTPGRDPKGLGVIVLAGGWRGTSAGRNRVLVRLCRRLLASGFHTMRFDYAGMGESTGAQKRTLADPSVEDLTAAAMWFQHTRTVPRRSRWILLRRLDCTLRRSTNPDVGRDGLIGCTDQCRRTIRARSRQ